jgi:hypothetical protein
MPGQLIGRSSVFFAFCCSQILHPVIYLIKANERNRPAEVSFNAINQRPEGSVDEDPILKIAFIALIDVPPFHLALHSIISRRGLIILIPLSG